jgi:outer membrane murein-binding lipoprotein Lpp
VLDVDLTGYDGDDTGVPLPEWLDSNKDGKADDATVVHKNLEAMSPTTRMDAISSFQGSIEGLKASITQMNSEKESYANMPEAVTTLIDEKKNFSGLPIQQYAVTQVEGIMDNITNMLGSPSFDVKTAAARLGGVTARKQKLSANVNALVAQRDALIGKMKAVGPAAKAMLQKQLDEMNKIISQRQRYVEQLDRWETNTSGMIRARQNLNSAQAGILTPLKVWYGSVANNPDIINKLSKFGKGNARALNVLLALPFGRPSAGELNQLLDLSDKQMSAFLARVKKDGVASALTYARKR